MSIIIKTIIIKKLCFLRTDLKTFFHLYIYMIRSSLFFNVPHAGPLDSLLIFSLLTIWFELQSKKFKS